MPGAGFLIYKKNLKNENEFLLLKKIDEEGFDIPKGTVDPGETFFKTAYRELEEEANLRLSDIEILKDRNGKIISYTSVYAKDEKRKLVLYIAKIKDSAVDKISLTQNPYLEHESFTWKNFYTSESLCLYYLKDIFNLGESLINNHEYQH